MARELKDGDRARHRDAGARREPRAAGVHMRYSENGLLGMACPGRRRGRSDLINAAGDRDRNAGCSYSAAPTRSPWCAAGTSTSRCSAPRSWTRGHGELDDRARWWHGRLMDFVAGAKRVVIAMEHDEDGGHKILPRCTLPFTG